MTTKNKVVIFQIVVGALIRHNGRVLIVRRSKNESFLAGYYELPGGKREPLETLENCVIREVSEETGLIVTISKIFSTFDYVRENEKAIKDSTQINFVVDTVDTDPIIQLSEEHDDYKWIDSSEIDKYLISEQTRNTLNKFFKLSI